jgi:hypothetical protein
MPEPVDVETPLQVGDARIHHPAIDGKRRERLCPGFAGMIDLAVAVLVIVVILAQQLARKIFCALRVEHGLVLAEQAVGALQRHVLGTRHAHRQDGGNRHHQQHGDEGNAAAAAALSRPLSAWHCHRSPATGTRGGFHPTAPG